MAFGMPGGGGQGPTLWMAIAARDRTGATFERVQEKIDNVGTMAMRTMSRLGSLAMSFATLGRVTGLLNDEQARAIGIFGTVMNVVVTLASVVKVLTAIEWAHVAALTWKVSLMTLGVGVAISAAAAMAVLAMQTNNAANAQRGYNLELERGSNLQQRRTANQRLVRRGGFEEVLE